MSATPKTQRLIEEAKAAIEALFSDTSVSQETTLEALRELADDLDMKIEALGG
jgi:hypothetical protein